LVSVKVKALDQRRNEEFHCEYCRNGAHIAWRSFCCRLSFCQFDCLAANFCSLAEEGQCDDLAVVCTESEGAALRLLIDQLRETARDFCSVHVGKRAKCVLEQVSLVSLTEATLAQRLRSKPNHHAEETQYKFVLPEARW